MTNFQEVAHGEDYDYEVGSPHLKHRRLRSRIESSLVREVQRLRSLRSGCRALEIGAGHGAFSSVLHEAGAEVTVTEMSSPSARHLEQTFRDQPAIRVVHDPDGSWAFHTADRFDLVVAISVLHHIPDYLAAVARYVERTEPGGTFVSWQDPMWYARQGGLTLFAARASYLVWRLGQGNWSRGLATVSRRIRGGLDESSPPDMTEYHVVREGVDEQALESLLLEHFATVQLTSYWSTQAGVLQRFGDRLHLSGTFSLVAHDRMEPVV